MTSRGLSGAQFTVWKRGPGCAEQGKYIQHLSPDVAPRTFSVTEYGYEMELLSPYQDDDIDQTYALNRIMGMLVTHVWPHQPVVRHDPQWYQRMWEWLGPERAYLYKYLDASYITNTAGIALPCRIHGDPTVANLMRRPDGTLVLADPLPPGGKIPSMLEVDVGKMLQSALGWERALRLDQPPALGSRFSDLQFLHMLGKESRRRAWLWCAIHLERAVPYLKARSRNRLATWAQDAARHVAATELR